MNNYLYIIHKWHREIEIKYKKKHNKGKVKQMHGRPSPSSLTSLIATTSTKGNLTSAHFNLYPLR
jgi:hypothetical protein